MLPALLRVKLGRHQVPLGYHAAESDAVVGLPGDEGSVYGVDIIAVDKVKICAIGYALEEGMGCFNLHLIPSYVRNLEPFGQSAHLSGD